MSSLPRSLCLLLLALAACRGQIGEAGDGDGDLEDPESGPAFGVPDGQPQLLPFWVRLERVAHVAGVTTDDPLLADLRTNRLALGDYDYASGVKPDRMWSPARMALWAKSLKPVCSSPFMREQYPALDESPANAASLASIAWGRDVAPEELTVDSAALATLDATSRYETTCLAILSSAEFVIQ